MKRPSTPASFMRRSDISGLVSPSAAPGRCGWPPGCCAACRRSAAATGAAAGWRRDAGTSWNGAPRRKSRMRLTGSRLNTSRSATFSRSLSMRKSVRLRSCRRCFQFSGAQQPAEPGRCLELLHLQRRAQDRRQIADVLGDEEVVLHEALDGDQAAAVVVAELRGEPRLHIERQHLLRAAAEEVQEAADGPQEVLAAAEGRDLLRA